MKSYRLGTYSKLNTMFPKHWDAARIQREVESAWGNQGVAVKKNMWVGKSNSGVTIRGYTKPNYTAFPVHESKVNR